MNYQLLWTPIIFALIQFLSNILELSDFGSLNIIKKNTQKWKHITVMRKKPYYHKLQKTIHVLLLSASFSLSWKHFWSCFIGYRVWEQMSKYWQRLSVQDQISNLKISRQLIKIVSDKGVENKSLMIKKIGELTDCIGNCGTVYYWHYIVI